MSHRDPRIGAVIVAERARRVYFVCPELYEAYRNQILGVRYEVNTTATRRCVIKMFDPGYDE